MTPERWRAITEIFHGAIAREAATRVAYLADACKDDESLRAEVEAMIAAHENAGSFGGPRVLRSAVKQVAAGALLGAYRIEALIGAGGMGEVYRARDTRLDRLVAIKILPPHLRQSPELQARFEREARMISQLTHPHIGTLYDIGREGDTDFLVMEHLDGETLATRLARGRVALGQALQSGIEIASALDHAHRRGIVHRDLKPSNVMLTKTGAKLLDFGLAKLARSMATGAADLENAPTLQTAEGTLVGTLAYMAPEQLEGKEADARADVWAFGCVLYELVTGRRAFDGETQATLIAAILEHEPAPVGSAEPVAPPLLDDLIQSCLAKDRDERCQAVADVKRTLQWIAKSSEVRTPPAVGLDDRPPLGSKIRHWVTSLSGALLLLSVLALAPVVLTSLRGKTLPPTLARLTLIPPKGVFVENAQISPDGRRIAFIGREADARGHGAVVRRLWIQSLDSNLPLPVSGTEGADNPFWAPDSQHLAFYVNEQRVRSEKADTWLLKKIDLTGGASQTLCQAYNVAGTWGRTGIIVFQAGAGDQPLFRVSAAGGVPVPATRLDSSRREIGHSSPHFLPDGRHFLYVVHSIDKTSSGLYVGSLDSAEAKRLLDVDTGSLYATPGYVLFSRDGALVAQPFDASRLQLAGEAEPIAHDADFQAIVGPPQFSTSVRAVPRFEFAFTIGSLGAGVFSASETGLLAYSLIEPTQYQFAWVDRRGAALGDIWAPAAFSTFDLSLDGKELIVARARIDRANLWRVDLDRNVASQITFDRAFEFDPRWGPDGRRLFSTTVSTAAGRRIVEIDLDGKESVLVDETRDVFLDDVSRDGRFLLLHSAQELRAFPLTGHRTPILVRRSHTGGFDQARFSPDGRFIAYESDEADKVEVYVERFPPTGKRRQISVSGGVQPVWRRDGHELYYLGLDGALFAVEFRVGTNINAGVPRRLFQAPVGGVKEDVEQYTTVDGNRFLVLKPVERPQRPINIIVNWPALVKK